MSRILYLQQLLLLLFLKCYLISSQIGYQDKFKDFHLCKHGRFQSPINLSHYQASATPMSQREFLFEYENWNDLQLELEQNPLNKFNKPQGNSSKIRIYNKQSVSCPYVQYEALQFHFHTPSEHSIDDKDPSRNPTLHPDIQMHVVHQIRPNYTDQCMKIYQKFMVLGVMFKGHVQKKVAYTGDDFFDKLNYKQDMDSYEQGGKAIFGQYLKLWFAAQGAYHYRGSLTTPGCDQAVDWYIAKQVQMVRKQTIKAIKQMIQNPSNRDVQPLNDRIVYQINKAAFKQYNRHDSDL